MRFPDRWLVRKTRLGTFVVLRPGLWCIDVNTEVGEDAALYRYHPNTDGRTPLRWLDVLGQFGTEEQARAAADKAWSERP